MAKTARELMQIHRPGLEIVSRLLDNLVGQMGKFTTQTYNYAKSVHAHRVFDKMPEASRQVLEWSKIPDGGLIR